MRGQWVGGCAAGLVLLIVPAAALGQTSEPETVAYAIRAVPNDPNSAVTHEIVLSLHPQAVSGQTIGWQVDAVAVSDLRGPQVQVWIDPAPQVDTADGLWWLTHPDWDAPTEADFVLPPLISGMAEPEAPAAPELFYELQGAAAGATTPYPTTAFVDFLIIISGEPLPEVEGESEPVELPPDHPPISS